MEQHGVNWYWAMGRSCFSKQRLKPIHTNICQGLLDLTLDSTRQNHSEKRKHLWVLQAPARRPWSPIKLEEHWARPLLSHPAFVSSTARELYKSAGTWVPPPVAGHSQWLDSPGDSNRQPGLRLAVQNQHLRMRDIEASINSNKHTEKEALHTGKQTEVGESHLREFVALKEQWDLYETRWQGLNLSPSCGEWGNAWGNYLSSTGA